MCDIFRLQLNIWIHWWYIIGNTTEFLVGISDQRGGVIKKHPVYKGTYDPFISLLVYWDMCVMLAFKWVHQN